jgi:regulator of extracellular matrix RemA (YlzA/DUF370 family)
MTDSTYGDKTYCVVIRCEAKVVASALEMLCNRKGVLI